MDEVFGNSSSDTVMEAELSQVLATIRSDLADLHHRSHPAPPTTTTTNLAHIVNRPQLRTSPRRPCSEDPEGRARLPTAAPRSCAASHLTVSSTGRPVPYPRLTPQAAPPLRHTQSAVEGRVHGAQSHSPRPRALSTGAATHYHHGYVNLHPARPLSTYDNVPVHAAPQPATPMPAPETSHAAPHATPSYINVPLSPFPGGSSSAPSTPRGGGRGQRLHHSYIELWSGVREERESLSDSECEELKRSFQEPQTPSSLPSPGYVEMSSPYIKSPQVTSPFNGSVLANFATKLASYAGHQPRNIFCPFCPRYFGYEKSLSSHIHRVHRSELNSMVENACTDLQLQFCPICQAQFFNTSVLPKHLIDFHRASVIEVLEKNGCIISDVVGIQCPFCTKKVPHGKTGEQVLLYHMQQLHMADYNTMIQTRFRPYTAASLESLKSLSSGEMSEGGGGGAFHPGLTSTPGLSNRLGTMSLAIQAQNLDATWSSHTGTFKSPLPPPPLCAPAQEDPQPQAQQEEKQPSQQLASSTSKGILRHQSVLGRKPSVKRELRFSVPPVTSQEVFVPESPEPPSPEPNSAHPPSEPQHPQQQAPEDSNRAIPVRVDSLSAADFMDLTTKAAGHRKRRKLGLGLRSRKAFKKKDKENIGEKELSNLVSGAKKVVDCGKKQDEITPTPSTQVVATASTRTFRRPKPVAIPRVPQLPPAAQGTAGVTAGPGNRQSEEEGADTSPFTTVKLYSPLRMFRCNGCRVKFCDNESLSSHIGVRHKGLLHLLRPQYGCGVCSAKFFENKYLVKHCLQHHTSLLEIRSPRQHKITIYRFTQD